MTHPFHPLRGQKFEMIEYRHAWGEERVYFLDTKGQMQRLPAAWTDVAAVDPFEMIAAGRSALRVEDLLQLADLIERLGKEV